MVGITAIGTYVPAYRLPRDEISRVWKTRGLGGERSVARHDEDSLTMAVAAARDCLRAGSIRPDAVFFSSTTPPYREKQTASLLAAVLDLAAETVTSDFTDSLRAGTTAMGQALDAVASGSADEVVITASDCRMSPGKSDEEQIMGDAAAAVSIGRQDVIARIEDRLSLYSPMMDVWRQEGSALTRSWENRFVVAEGYVKTMLEAVTEIMKRQEMEPEDVSRIVFNGPDSKSHSLLAKRLGFNPTVQVEDPMFHSIGNTGSAAVFLMLAEALESAEPGDRILLANYGDGADAYLLRVTEGIRVFQSGGKRRAVDEKRILVDYETYLGWRDLLQFENPRHPANRPTSLACSWRERKSILPFYGGKCTACGAVHYPAQRVCTRCQAKDACEDYKLSNKRGQVFTYAVDQLSWGKERPLLVGVVDFDGGGRVMCEICDCDPDQVHIGMPVQMVFRKLDRDNDFEEYFWKAKPVA